jgi:hypothetical protein
MFALSFLSAKVFETHDRSAFSLSGTKNDERRESTVSKFAEPDVI